MKPRRYCYFCREFKNDVKLFRLHFGEIHVCRGCAVELILLLERVMGDGWATCLDRDGPVGSAPTDTLVDKL